MPIEMPIAMLKAMQTASNNAKLAITQMMKNHCAFACQISELGIMVSDGDDQEIVYPDSKQTNQWLVELFCQHLAPRQLNEKAILAMRARGIQSPSQSLRDMLVVVVTSSQSHVHAGISVPPNSAIGLAEFIEQITAGFGVEVTMCDDAHGKYALVWYMADSPFKQRDTLLQRVFDQLKCLGVYVDEDEDEMVFDEF